MSNAMAEKELQRLRALPENRVCPNCCKKDTGLGFQAVCVAFKTFVCSDCKSSHQAFSHRCKSVSMSNWTMMEVQALDERNAGGNRAASQQWLAGVPESARPRPDSHVDVKKAFIERAYNKREWVGSCSTGNSVNATPTPPANRITPQKLENREMCKQSSAPKHSSQAIEPPKVSTINLLDDDSFSAAPPAPLQPPVAASNSNQIAHSCNLLDVHLCDPPVSQQSSLGGFDPLIGDPIGQNSGTTYSGSAFSFISAPQVQLPEQQVRSPPDAQYAQQTFQFAAPLQPAQQSCPANGSAFSFVAASLSTQPAQAPSESTPSNGSAFSFIGASQSANLCANITTPMQQQACAASQLNPTYGNFGFGQPASQVGGGQPIQQCQAPIQNCFGIGGPSGVQGTVSGYPGMASSNANTSNTSSNPGAGGPSQVQGGWQKPQAQSSNQTNSFDPFDPFAPEPISVC